MHRSSRKYFLRLATNPSWPIAQLVERRSTETRRCEFESRSRQRIFRCSLQCQINMNLVFHISEDSSEINAYSGVFCERASFVYELCYFIMFVHSCTIVITVRMCSFQKTAHNLSQQT